MNTFCHLSYFILVRDSSAVRWHLYFLARAATALTKKYKCRRTAEESRFRDDLALVDSALVDTALVNAASVKNDVYLWIYTIHTIK